MTSNYLSILSDIYTTEDATIYNQIVANEFIYEYMVIEVSVCNAGIATNTFFTNDLIDDNYDDGSMIFNVEELNQIEDLKSIIEESKWK